MIKQKSYDFILMGLYLRYLHNVVQSKPKDEVVKGLERLKDLFLKLGFDVSIEHIKLIIGGLKPMWNDIQPNDPVGETTAKYINNEVLALEKTVYSESSSKILHQFSQRRYNNKYLDEESHKLLKENLFDKLSDLAKFDFVHACKCLLFGEGTASAFHILRCTEDTLKHYYYKHKKTNRLKNPMWGSMTTELKNKKQIR